MTRFLGAVFLVLIIIGVSQHMNGQTWVAMVFYVGCFAIGVMLLVKLIMRHWW